MLHSFFSIWLSFWPSPLFPLGAFLIGWCQMIRPQETFGSHMKKWKVWQPRLPRLVYPDWLGTGGFSHLWLWLSFVSSCLQYCQTSVIILDTSSMNLAACTITECLETKPFSFPQWATSLLFLDWAHALLQSLYSICMFHLSYSFHLTWTQMEYT